MIWQYQVVFPLMLLWSEHYSVAQDCLQGAETTETQIPFEDLGPAATPLPTGSQAIVTSYQFQCCGEVTEWGTFVQADRPITINFQVWRPSPTSGGGGSDCCYRLVGENRFSVVTISSDNLIQETPLSSDRISVRPGDVLGYSVIGTGGPNDGIQLDSSFTNEAVFYTDIADSPLPMGPVACPVSAGPGGMLSQSTNAAPILSVEISTSNCPTPSPIMISSTHPAPQPSPTPTPPPVPTSLLPPPTTPQHIATQPPPTTAIPPPTAPPAPQTQPPTTPPTADTDLSITLTRTMETAMPDQTIPTSPGTDEIPFRPPDNTPEQPTLLTIAPSNTETTTDTVASSTETTTETVAEIDNEPTFLPTVIGVVVTTAILTASLLTLLVGVTIIRRKMTHKHKPKANQDLDIHVKSPSANPDQDRQQDRDDELIYNSAYIMNTHHIPLQPNLCYASRSPSADAEKNPAERKENNDHELVYNNAYSTCAPPNLVDYDYVPA